MNPYKIEPPFYLAFSGGRTSGYMLRHVLDAWGGSMPEGGHVLFANTGKEHEATLEFVRKIEQNWCQVTWLEWQDAQPKRTFRVVSFETASRNGEPFEALIKCKGFLPNPVIRFCTGELKINTMHRYMRSLGYKMSEIVQVIGLRYDEERRVVKLRNDPKQDIAMPLADSGITRTDVVSWWKAQPFDLELPNDDHAFGNCDLCFLKGMARVERVIRAEPDRASWWAAQEVAINATFRKDRPSYAQLLTQITVQGHLFQHLDDHTIPCDCTE